MCSSLKMSAKIRCKGRILRENVGPQIFYLNEVIFIRKRQYFMVKMSLFLLFYRARSPYPRRASEVIEPWVVERIPVVSHL